MAIPVSDKLKIRENHRLLTLHAPPEFRKGLKGLPPGVKFLTAGKVFDQVHWFVLNKTQLEREMDHVMKLLKPEVILWVYFPKAISKKQTDLTRDKGWDRLQAYNEKLTWINLLSFDDTWSVFGIRKRNEADKKREVKQGNKREIFHWVNPKTKEIRLPEDFSKLLLKHKKQASFFETLSFTNKKEYIEWIVTAKRKETRKERLQRSIDRLGMGWKNPANNG